MSNYDLLSREDLAAAKQQGWTLCFVFDLKTKRLRPEILSLTRGVTHRSASQFVVAQARNRDALSIRALRSLQEHSRTPA